MDVNAVMCPASDPNCTTDEFHVFGTDADGETFCCILTPTAGTGVNWWIRMEGSRAGDTFGFSHNGYQMHSYDTSAGGNQVVISVDGDAGNDTITLPTNNLNYTSEIWGGADNDDITGSPLQDDIWGEGGQDVIDGGGGDDRIDGGPQQDELYGGDGDDIMCAGPAPSSGSDLVDGELGDDFLWGGDSSGAGDSDLYCGNGLDEYGGEGPGSVTCPGDTMRSTPLAFCN